MKNRYLILAALSVLLYLPSLFGGLMWDDEDIIVGDHLVHSFSNAGKVFTADYWKRDFPGAESRYRPLRSLLLMAEWEAWGKTPAGYHAVSAALNAAAVCLAFWLSLLLFKDPDKAFVSALIFALHPAHVESVAWLKNASDILMFIFAAISAGLVLKGSENESGRWRIAAGAAVFSLALASKESAVALPALLFGWLAAVRRAPRYAALKATLPLWVMSAAFLFFAVYFLRRSGGLPEFQLKNSLLALAQYSRLIFLPFDLNAERGLVTALDVMGPLAMGGLAFYFYRQRDRIGLYSLLWMLLCLVPFLDMRFVTGRPIAEQRLYMAVLGLGFSAGAFYRPILSRRLAIGAVAVLFGFFSAARNFDWLDPVRFWEKTAASSPGSARAHNNLGVSYERVRRFQDALVQYETAAALDRAGASSRLNLADLLYKGGRPEEAAGIYGGVHSKEPSNRRAVLGLARIKLEAGDLAGAEELLIPFLQARPSDPEALNSMGVVEMARGAHEAALAYFEKAMAANPEYADAVYNMAVLFQSGGDLKKAAGAYDKLLRMEPSHPDALNNLAIIRDIGGDEAGAIELFKRNELLNPQFYKSAYNLGGIYYRKKMYLEALGEFTRVLDAVPGHEGARHKAEEIRGRLDGTVKK